MGNCLDIPPPPPKRRPTSEAKLRHTLENTTSGPMKSVPRVYSAYQPYPAFDGSPSVVVVDPLTGRPYSYPMNGSPDIGEVDPVDIPVLTSPYYTNPEHLIGSTGNYNNLDDAVRRESRHKTRRSRKERRSQNGEIPDRNSNTQIRNSKVNSTIITTFSDPQDDVIKRGHEIIISSGTPRSQNGVISTITSGIINTTTAAAKTATASLVRSSSTDGSTIANQNLVVQTHVNSAPVATRGSTYVTYIEDEPPPMESVVEETIQTEEETHRIQLEEELLLEKEETQVFRETGEADEGIIQLYIDEPITKRTVLKENTSALVTSASLKRISSTYHSSLPPRDVVLCYDPADAGVMWRIKKKLQSTGFTVAVSGDSSGKVGEGFFDWPMFSQAVIDSKIMVVILSPHSIKNKHLKDEVSLAQVTETSVYPVVLGQSQQILGAMDIGLKLQLASYKWTEFNESENSDINIDILVRSVKEELDIIKNYDVIDEDYGEVSSWAQRRRKVIKQGRIRRLVSYGGHLTAIQYWDRFYANGVHSIPWEIFYKDLRIEYRELLNSTVPKSCIPHLIENLKRELEVTSDGLVHKVQFVEFCTELDTDQDVWERIRSVARETQAIRDVFDVESTVRLVAIENIDKFSSQRVMHALQELLTDSDPNIRAGATMSLSRCMLSGDHMAVNSLMVALDDQDRFVREAGCLAMGHLRAREAVNKLIFLWRNDTILEVREAAAVALKEIRETNIKDAMSNPKS